MNEPTILHSLEELKAVMASKHLDTELPSKGTPSKVNNKGNPVTNVKVEDKQPS